MYLISPIITFPLFLSSFLPSACAKQEYAVWEELTVAGVPRLAEHCAVAIGDNVILFGGIRDGTRRNTVYQWTAGSNTMTGMGALPTEPSMG